ncbi:MAG: tRNA (adenosine(37)-N6)-threonylcarbamoyltransferase complex dimerization subunit type 1 TsaB [Deltaproteobacteria bacterium]|nr:tRNA (adenosine(37)-N6)-threonylcarbamoyltransferase complex dimerization subunit type 1 TsaB [Deltaproteobacteria bacterium]
MTWLAVDTSQLQAAVCLLDGANVVAGHTGSVDVAHSEGLLPHVDSLLRKASIRLDQLDGFAAGVGPGSFTGIRIGCATIKALAQVLGKPVVAFSSLRATALSLEAADDVVAIVNAYQGQVFAGWTDEAGTWREDALTADAWAGEHGRSVSERRFCGNGAKPFWKAFEGLPGARLTDLVHVTPDGIARAVKDGKRLTYRELSANYLRPSQAEAKLASALAK